MAWEGTDREVGTEDTNTIEMFYCCSSEATIAGQCHLLGPRHNTQYTAKHDT